MCIWDVWAKRTTLITLGASRGRESLTGGKNGMIGDVRELHGDALTWTAAGRVCVVYEGICMASVLRQRVHGRVAPNTGHVVDDGGRRASQV
jgi:hypothetical protein